MKNDGTVNGARLRMMDVQGWHQKCSHCNLLSSIIDVEQDKNSQVYGYNIARKIPSTKDICMLSGGGGSIL